MDEIKIKQLPVSEEHACAFHKKNKNGKNYESSEILPHNMCPWLYHTLYPYYLTLLHGGKFDWNERGDVQVGCPAAEGIDLVVKKRDNDGTIHPDITKDMKYAVYADVVKVNGECPSNHKVGDRFVFPTVWKEKFLCSAGYNHVFPLMNLKPPKCLDKKAVRCPKWNEPVFYDVTKE